MEIIIFRRYNGNLHFENINESKRIQIRFANFQSEKIKF